MALRLSENSFPPLDNITKALEQKLYQHREQLKVKAHQKIKGDS